MPYDVGAAVGRNVGLGVGSVGDGVGCAVHMWLAFATLQFAAHA